MYEGNEIFWHKHYLTTIIIEYLNYLLFENSSM